MDFNEADTMIDFVDNLAVSLAKKTLNKVKQFKSNKTKSIIEKRKKL